MVSSDNGNGQVEIEESHSNNKLKNPTPLRISTSQGVSLSNETPKTPLSQDSVTPLSSKSKFFSIGNLASPSAKFRNFAEGRDDFSRSVPALTTSHNSLRERLSGAFARKIDWGSLKILCKEWIRNPVNMALFVWIVCVAVSGAILFLVMTGMLDHALPKKTQRDAWFEVNNQILNALFTLMCLYQHPKRLYHLILLCRWQPKDITRLRKIYCKNGTYKPHEWAHMMVVIFLLNLNCFAQYALCGLNLGYKRSERPAIGVGVCISFAIGAPAIAGVYLPLSPLGRDYEPENDEESQVPITTESVRPSHLRLKSLQRRYSFAIRNEERVEEGRPQWRGGIFDFWDDISLAYLSLFCSFCVFGWNMERLGFGNMFVHIATFLLFCMAPFWIFTLAAVNIDNEVVREALGITGIILCIFGLLYGGFWRIQMRKRFNLPGNKFCCGRPAITDCAQWLCCCWCSLAQEVRTANFYDIVEDKFYKKEMAVDVAKSDEPGSGSITPLENIENSTKMVRGNSPSPSRFARQLDMVEEESSTKGMDETMIPPVPSSIQKDS